jgi:hypothetical protein
MAYTPLNLGYNPSAGLKYTATVDSVADFPLVPNNTFFFNKTDQEVFYKDNGGNVLVVFGTAYSGGGNSAWQPMDLALDSWLSSGASTLVNANAGFQKSFSPSANNSVVAQIPLNNEGINYDGSSLKLRLNWQLFNTITGVGSNVIWIVSYVFVTLGEDADSKLATTTANVIDVSTRLPNTLYVDDLNIMNGSIGDKVVNLTLTRFSSGAGSDTYSNAVDIFGIELIKI